MTKEVPEVAQSVRAIRDEFSKKYPNIDFKLSGIVMMNTSFPEAAIADNMLLLPIMIGVVCLIMMVMLKSLFGTLSTLVVIILSILTAIGSWGWLGGYMSGPSMSFPIMVLTLAVADCVHILSTYYYNMRHGMEKRNAIIDSLRVNMQPIFLTSVTTALGFLTMNFSDSPPFAHLGNIVAIGVIAAFVFAVSLFPALLMIFPTRVKQIEANKKDSMDKFADFVIHNKKWLLPVMALVIIGLASLVPKNELNDDFVKYFDESVPFRQASDLMQEKISGMTNVEISFNTKESSGINEPKFVAFVDAFAEWLREQPETDNVNTITDTLKRLNKNMHGDNTAMYKLPEERDLIAQYLFLYEMSLPQGLDVNNQLNVDKSSTRVTATLKNITSNQMIAIEKRIYKHFESLNSNYEMQIASPSLMFAHIGKRNIISMLEGTAVALVIISLLLGFALRSLKFGLISLLPNLTPAAVGFGVWALLDGEIGLGLSVVTGMTLGIIVDDTVHFLSKYVRARREKGYSAEEAVRYSFASVGKALWVTTMVLVAGFMVLATSSFKFTADMGLLTAITILIALIIDFLFLPPLLMLLGKKDAQTN
jgi:predicted RND superfamily exporter protein